jgi:hypothetical protein
LCVPLTRTCWRPLFFLLPSCCPLQVVEGYEAILAAEACGSRSGATSYEITIADCGQLNQGE